MLNFILILTLSHFIADFILQPNSWVESKKENGLNSKHFYWHILIHAITLSLLLQYDLKFIGGFIITIVSHTIIDYGKLFLDKKYKNRSRQFFLIDQFLHTVVIAFVVRLYFPFTISYEIMYNTSLLIIVTSLAFASGVSAILIKILMSPWNKSIDTEKSLKNAGFVIGLIERTFVFTFVLLNHWEVVGFMLAAKSVFRFGDLSHENDRKLTEYVIIGTFISFAFAIGAALICQYLLGIV